ncbi:MAG: hypothetical protein FWD01_00015 [Defluviitaleaceae bacterium]|nr:hypothetical protein [Defluviitaleaceae bacterium]
MSLRPVDMQIILPRAQEIARISNQDGVRSETQNNQFAQQFQKVVSQEGQTVSSTHETAHQASVDKDGRNGDTYQGRNKKRNSGDEREENNRNNKNGLNMDENKPLIDIRI